MGLSGVCMGSIVWAASELHSAIRSDQCSMHFQLYESVVVDANVRPVEAYSGLVASAKGVRASHLTTNDVSAGVEFDKSKWGRTSLVKE